MPTIEERLQALEQEHSQLKKTVELQTIAIRALASKEAFEKLQEAVEKSQEQNNKLFDVLMAHDSFTNEQLAELRTQQIETDGKIAGLQTEMRQRLGNVDVQLSEHKTLLTEILARLPKPQP